MTQKIKVEADVASFQAELSDLTKKIAELDSQLRTASGKSQFNFKGSRNELNELLKLTEKLTAALENADKKSANYAKNMKEAQQAISQAAKISAKLEEAGSAKNRHVSGYFRDFAGELGNESALIRRIQEEKSRRDKLIQKYTQGAGTLLGSVIGGGGVGSIAGAGLGSLVGGPLGLIASALGGAIGGRFDKGYGDAKQSALTYSEIRKAAGGLGADFHKLRETVQGLNTGLGVTHVEAAQLAKQFTITGNVTADKIQDIGYSLRTSAGFGRGYGLDPSQGVGFFALMRQNGVARTEGDNRKLALMIGESVAKSGNTAKMGEVLESVSSWVSSSTRASLSEANVGGYLSMLSSLSSTGLAGLVNSPGNAAAILNHADQSVRSGGARGEASRNFLYAALQSDNPAMNALDLNLLLEQGLMGDAKKAFGPDSAAYKAAEMLNDEKTKQHYRELSSNSHGTNMASIMKSLEARSGGNTAMLLKSMGGVFGGSESDNAALYRAFGADTGLGKLKSILSSAGIDLERLETDKIGALAGVALGDTDSLKKQWKKLQDMGMSSHDVSTVNDILKNKGEGEEFRQALIKMTAKYDKDSGEQMLQKQADIANGIQELVENLIPTEIAIKDGILELVKHFAPDSAFGKKLVDDSYKQHSTDLSKLVEGDQWKTDVLNQYAGIKGEGARKEYLTYLRRKIANLPNANNPKYKKQFDDYFNFSDQLETYADNPYLSGFTPPRDASVAPDMSSHQPDYVAPASGDWTKRFMNDLASKEGLNKAAAAGVVGNLSYETGGFRFLQEKNPKFGLGGYGAAQWTGPRRDEFLKYAKDKGLSPDTYEANFGFLHHELNSDQYKSVLDSLRGSQSVDQATEIFARGFEKPGVMALNKRIDAANAAFNAADQMPAAQQKSSGQKPQSAHHINISGLFTLRDSLGREISDPLTHTWFSQPQPGTV
jgi:hypothetical protein